MSCFEELLYRNEEFDFIYNGVQYAVISVFGRSLYMDDGSRCGVFISSFKDNKDLFANAVIEGKKISEILDDIIV